MIEKFKLENFRGFHCLELNSLQRVNLVMGQNNSGKTSLLEALCLTCDSTQLETLSTRFRPAQGDPDNRYFRWLARDGSSNGYGRLTVSGLKDGVPDTWAIDFSSFPLAQDVDKIRIGSPVLYNSRNIVIWGDLNWRRRCEVIPVGQPPPGNLVELVGAVHRISGGEEQLQQLVGKVDPRIRKIRIDPGADGNQVIVDVGLRSLIPVSQAGQGVYRLMHILSVIIGRRPEVVLIDEIENGLHHTVHRQIWAGLAEVAEALKVQIFATTHSGECFEAAHAAFLDRSAYDLGVIQLFRETSGIQGRVLQKERIEAAIDGDIDLR